METRKSVTAGVVNWTPAPVRSSPTSSVISESEWEDEDEEQAAGDDDFFSQMDENGIIGLSEALREMEFRGASCGPDPDCSPDVFPGPVSPEEAELSGGFTAPEELSDGWTQSPGEAGRRLPCGDLTGSFSAQLLEVEARQQRERSPCLNLTEEEKDGGGEGRTRQSRGPEVMSAAPSCSGHLPLAEPSGVCSHQRPASQPASPVAASSLPQCLRSYAEEIAAAPGIQAETLPDLSFTESPPESHRSGARRSSIPRPQRTISVPAQPESESHRAGPAPSPRRTRQQSPPGAGPSSSQEAGPLKARHQSRSPKAGPDAAALHEPRKGPRRHRTPDFSSVGPRVHFPRDGYKPPKSRVRCTRRDPLLPEPPLVFKSPADIVKEVLLNMPDSSPSDSDTAAGSAPDFIVPHEFRCRRHVITLVQQLQEDYNKLLTKYAEAENTIDRLRLGAKVNLYSDPPQPGHLVPSSLSHSSSKVMMLDLQPAQRAVLSSASPQAHSPRTQGSSPVSSSARSPAPQAAQQAAKILCSQADKFLQQLQTFKELLNRGKLQPSEQVKVLSQLAKGLGSLEKGYLVARDEHKLLQQQQGAHAGHFDAERELEQVIFQCGLHLDELKEQVEQTQQEQPSCEAPPTPPPRPATSSCCSEQGSSPTHPQRPPTPSLLDPGGVAAVEVSSASEWEDEEMEDEETLYLTPLDGKHSCTEQHFPRLMDHFQSFKELPRLPAASQGQDAAIRSDPEPAAERDPPSQRSGSPHQSEPERRHSRQQASTSTPPPGRLSSRSTTLPPRPPAHRGRLEVGRSHSSSLSSLGEIAAPERRSSKLQPGGSRGPAQDRIISPETDSGFVGSESGCLAAAAAPGPVHQGAPASVSGPVEVNPGRARAEAAPAPSPASSSRSHRLPAAEPCRRSRLSPERPRRTKQRSRRRTFSCSPPQPWGGPTEPGRAQSGSSGFGLDSDSTYTVSDGRSSRYSESLDSGSSPAAPRHHDTSPRAPSAGQAAQRGEEMSLLERLERFQRNKQLLIPERAAPTLRHTSAPLVRWSSSQRRGGRQRLEEAEVSPLRRTGQRQRQRPPPDTSSGQCSPQPQPRPQPQPQPQPRPLVSRRTQTSPVSADSSSSHTHSDRRRPGVCLQVCEAADEADSRVAPAPLCAQCESRHCGQPEASACVRRHCPRCGCLRPSSSAEPACRLSATPPHTRLPPAESQGAAAAACSRHLAAAAPAPAPAAAAPPPPPLLQYMPVCPASLLLCSLPVDVPASSVTAASSSSRAGREARERPQERRRRRRRRSLSADEWVWVECSLDRANTAAQHMKQTSRHMARSLSSSLHYQQLLSSSTSR